MILKTIKNKINDATYVFQSVGMLILIYRLIGYFWMECFVLYLRVSTRGVLIKRAVCGHIMYVDYRSAGVSKWCAVFGINEPQATHLLSQEIKPGMHVVDVGAHIGYYTLQFARLVGESGEVIAVEPTPENKKVLMMNVEANGYRNVRIYEVAIGAENGTARLYLSHNSAHSSLILSDEHYSYVEVPLRTLDTLLEQEERIDYIKMDIQGSEIEAIKGMQSILQKYRPALFIETHSSFVGCEAIIQLLEDLKKLGYENKYIIDFLADHPGAKKKANIIRMSIDDIKTDKRVIKGQLKPMLFLGAN